MSKDNLNKITDKELLAICNLSNLKMEFADTVLKRDITTGKVLSNHTIYSLLLQEVEAIKSNTESKRIFLMETEDKKNKKIVKTPIYKNIIDLKKKAGIVYEYCEKYSFDGNLII